MQFAFLFIFLIDKLHILKLCAGLIAFKVSSHIIKAVKFILWRIYVRFSGVSTHIIQNLYHTYYNVLPTRIRKGKDVSSSELLPLLSPSVKRGCVVSEGRHNRDSQPKPSSASNWSTASVSDL